MKKLVLVFVSIVFISIFILVGCTVDLYSGKRPIDQNNTIWNCETLDIYFEVNDEYREKTAGNTYGKIVIDGKTTEIMLVFDYGVGVSFMPIDAYHKADEESDSYLDGSAVLFEGSCKFKPDKMVVKITENPKGFLDESIEELIFYKT